MIPEEMTLRDWFAGQAMQAYITAVRGCGEGINVKELTETSFHTADAMMGARKK